MVSEVLVYSPWLHCFWVGRKNIMAVSKWWSKAAHLIENRRGREKMPALEGFLLLFHLASSLW
jgi:hypothetical protein